MMAIPDTSHLNMLPLTNGRHSQGPGLARLEATYTRTGNTLVVWRAAHTVVVPIVFAAGQVQNVQLVLLGAPGSGKGTQGLVLARRFGVRHVSSGELLRRHVAAETELGREVRDYLARGDLVPDELLMAVVGDALEDAVKAGGYVLEGIPRTLAQAERAYALVAPSGPVADAVIYLNVPDDVVRARLAQREDVHRNDDEDPAVIERRLQVFHAETGPLLDFYRCKQLLITVDGAQSPADVTTAIVDALAGTQLPN